MNDYTEFQAKNLDAAIQDACTHFGTERTKLEIEILEDSKSGIFGLVGARKARVKARLAQLPSLSSQKTSAAPKKPVPNAKTPKNTDAPAKEQKSKVQTHKKPDAYDEEEGEGQRSFLSKMNHGQDEELEQHLLDDLDRKAAAKANLLGNVSASEINSYQPRDNSHENSRRNAPNKGSNNGRVRAQQSRVPQDKNDKPFPQKDADKDRQELIRQHKERRQVFAKTRETKTIEPNSAEAEATAFPRIPLVELDQEKLLAVSRDTLFNLIKGIVGEDAPMEIIIVDDRVKMTVESEETGLLIGREGQHLASIQYLAARIITRSMQSQVRVQLDSGDYHMRQDSRIHDLALSLAEKVKGTGRSYSTRPLSAYQRRVVHMALHDDPEVQTRSSGDGTQKRVIIMRARPQNDRSPLADVEVEMEIDNEEQSFNMSENQSHFEHGQSENEDSRA